MADARAAGCESGLGERADGLWLGHTDADSMVPQDWIARQMRYADQGARVVAGTVEVDSWLDWPAGLRGHYGAFCDSGHGAGGNHVHGANLYLRLSMNMSSLATPASRRASIWWSVDCFRVETRAK